jgi:hypothetical protein
MPSESKDKKEKKDKKDKGGESESKKDKKEKKDKAEKSEEGKSKDKKEKSSKSKDKDKTKDTKESKSKDKGKEGKDIITAGSTTYRAHVTRDTEGKKMRCWVPEGKQLTENEFVWIEHVDGSTSERYFANKADPNIRKWELPEISSTAAGANAAVGGGQAGTDAAMKFVEEKHFKERKEFKEKEAKKPVATAARKAVAAAQEKGILTKDEATILAMNVAKEYMSLHRKWDADGEKWVRDNAAEQIALIEDRKKEYATSMMTRQVKADSLSGASTREEDLPIPTSASPNLTFPTSPLLPRASYLRDPYFFRRVNRRNPKREMEAMFEDKLFLQPGAGTVRVLSAVRCKVGSAEKESFACVVRDWAGAFMLVFAEATTMGLLVITSAYPLLEHVDLQRSSEAKGVLFIDDIPFQMAFANGEEMLYLVDTLKIAMCAMYGQGSDDHRITTMRAYAVEFSSMESTYYPGGVVPDVKKVMTNILTEDLKDGVSMDPHFQAMRLCMRTPEGRDAVLRAWVRSMNDGAVIKNRRPAAIANHIRVIEEAVRHPSYHNDLSIPGSVIANLALLRSDQPEGVKARIEAARTSFRVITPILEQWRSRADVEDRPFELMFEPAEGSKAWQQAEVTLAQRRAQYAQSQLLPGIYVTLLCYSGNSVLCDHMGNLFSEVIVSSPSTQELDELTPDNEDFRWILSLGGAGAPDDWAASEIAAWSDVYDNAGRQTFRAKFLQAARRLFEEQHVPSLGVVFDVPVVHKAVSCAHILCVLRIESKDSIPASVGEWRNATEFESTLYLQTCVASHSSRIEFLPTAYNNCVRSIRAAIDYRTSLDKRLPGGFYLGHLVLTLTSGGPMVLVPESSRNTVPLALISEEMPSLEQWRWIQGLNERFRRTRSFGLNPETDSAADAVSALLHVTSHSTFEQRFAKAVAEAEAATGVSVEKFYDLDLFVLDEESQGRAVFAVHVVPPTYHVSTEDGKMWIDTPSGGQVPMVWKHASVVDDAYFRMYWPRTFTALIDERNAHLRRATATCQPFTTDEVCRLQHESSLSCFCDVDKYSLLVSWCRPITDWVYGSAQTLVEMYGGVEDEAVARSIDEAVEIAVSNYASTQDINVQTMKSLIIESASTVHFSWPTLLSKLREIDRVVALGYAQRLVNEIDKRGAHRRLMKVRTYDELESDPDSDDEAPRAATDYDLPCTLEELILKDTSLDQAEKYFYAQELVHDIVELASIQCVEVGEVKEIGNIITDMITVIESAEDLVDTASIVALRQEAEEAALEERTSFQQHWLDVFQNDSELQDLAGKRPDHLEQQELSPARALEMQEAEEDLDNPLNAPLYSDGSSRFVNSYEAGVRVCMAKAMNSAHAMETLLRVASSAMNGLEVVQGIQEYAGFLAKRDSLVKARPAGDGSVTPQGGSSQSPAPGGAGRRVDAGQAAVTVVSKEFVEHPIAVVDPLRCLVLHNVSGRVRFPTVPTAALEVIADHLNQSDFNVPQALQHMRPDKTTAAKLLEVALQMKAPLLVLRLATLVFGTQQGPAYFFTNSSALQLRTLLQDGFLFEYGIKDWLHLEVLGGDPVASAMDVLWWIRFLKEAVADVGNERRDSFSDHEGTWKQVYTETRVRVFLSFGVHALNKDEVTLWAHSLGRYVEYLSLKDTSVGDAEIEVLSQCCPNIKSLDLSFTNITARAVEALINGCTQLIECSVEGCDVPSSAHDQLRRHCVDNRNRGVA